jgi:hypothetical protein
MKSTQKTGKKGSNISLANNTNIKKRIGATTIQNV